MKEIKETTQQTPTATTQEGKKKLPKGTERFGEVSRLFLTREPERMYFSRLSV